MDEFHYDDESCVFQMKAADRKRQAERLIADMIAAGEDIHPVKVPARGKVAKSFWGHLWCRHIESYEDMSYRVDLGRSHARSGSIIDLKVGVGEANALVLDGELFAVKITVDPLDSVTAAELADLCLGEVQSVFDLLSGKLSERVMTVLTSRDITIFPDPREIKFSCNCLDYADLCLHAASALYGLGVLGDHQPDIFFQLRSIEAQDFVIRAADSLVEESRSTDCDPVLGRDLGNLFGIDLDGF